MRVATFNLLHGAGPIDRRVDLDRLVTSVRTLDADILALQEVDRGQSRSHRADLAALIAAATGAESWWFLPVLTGDVSGPGVRPAQPDDPPDAPAYGLALISRYPSADWRTHRLPRLRFRYPTRRGRRWHRVPEEPRGALAAELSTPAGTLTVVATHLSVVPGSRHRQLRRLIGGLAAVPDPVLLLGDLNLRSPRTARAAGFRALATRPTYPADQPIRQLDHVLLRGRLGTVTSTATPALPVSDHRPLVVDLAL